MNTSQSRIANSAGLFVCVFVFGFWLSLTGKPYNVVLFTIHKLAALGAVLYLARMVYKVHQAAPFTPATMMILGLTALCYLAAFVSGVFLSLETSMPAVVLRLHQAAPFLALLSTSASLYLLRVKSITIQAG